MTLPDFLVIGAQRAGTTLLHRLLAAHPEVYVPTARKEIHYFDRYFERGPAWYRGYFPGAEEAARYRAIGEVTPDYLSTPHAAERIRATLPGCRLVAILRDPVERVVSWHRYCVRSHNERRDLATFLAQETSALEGGLYHRHLDRYLGLFPEEALHILILEELLAAPGPPLAALARFLGLGEAFPAATEALEEKVNASLVPRFRRGFSLARSVGGLLMRHDVNWPSRLAKRLGARSWFGKGGPPPPLAPELRRSLAEYYAADVERLAAFLGRDLCLWRTATLCESTAAQVQSVMC
jgi:hypothetical protein